MGSGQGPPMECADLGLDETGGQQLASPSASKMMQGLVFSEVQRLQAVLKETTSTASMSENRLKQECEKLEDQVHILQRQLEEQSAGSSPRPHSPLEAERRTHQAPPLPVPALPTKDSITLPEFEEGVDILEEGSDDEFWELSILPDESEMLQRSVTLEASNEAEECRHAGCDSPRGLDDSAMEDLAEDGDYTTRLKLVKVPLSECGDDEGAPNRLSHPLDNSADHQPGSAPGSEVDDGDSSASGDSLPGELLRDIAGEGLQQDLDSYTDTSSLAGYTFGKADMEALMAEGESLQTLVNQLTTALERADDEKFQLEEHLREMVLSKRLSQQEEEANYPPETAPGWMAGLPTQIRSLSTKHESLYEELLRRLDQSRSALHQSQETQNKLRKMVDTLRADNESLQTALSATEAVQQLYKAKADAASRGSGLEELEAINKKLQSVEPWCQRARKSVQSSTPAAMAQHQSYFDHLSRTSKSQVAEILALREENQHLTSSMASLSIKFAEADSKHTVTKRALARAQSRVDVLVSQLQAAGIAPADADAGDEVLLPVSTLVNF